MGENNAAAILLGIVAVIAVLGLIAGNTNITGFASASADSAVQQLFAFLSQLTHPFYDY